MMRTASRRGAVLTVSPPEFGFLGEFPSEEETEEQRNIQVGDQKALGCPVVPDEDVKSVDQDEERTPEENLGVSAEEYRRTNIN